MRTRKVLAYVVASLAIVAGVVTVRALPWSTDMVRGRAVAPQTRMLVPAPNTLAVGHPRILDRIEATERLTNPLPPSPEVLAQGHALFDTYCAVCHGANGRTPGPVGKFFPAIPDLSATTIQAYADGLIYSVIREGGFSMPGYAETMSVPERWALVRFVRTFR